MLDHCGEFAKMNGDFTAPNKEIDTYEIQVGSLSLFCHSSLNFPLIYCQPAFLNQLVCASACSQKHNSCILTAAKRCIYIADETNDTYFRFTSFSSDDSSLCTYFQQIGFYFDAARAVAYNCQFHLQLIQY